MMCFVGGAYLAAESDSSTVDVYRPYGSENKGAVAFKFSVWTSIFVVALYISMTSLLKSN